jgi:hypothetical protein
MITVQEFNETVEEILIAALSQYGTGVMHRARYPIARKIGCSILDLELSYVKQTIKENKCLAYGVALFKAKEHIKDYPIDVIFHKVEMASADVIMDNGMTYLKHMKQNDIRANKGQERAQKRKERKEQKERNKATGNKVEANEKIEIKDIEKEAVKAEIKIETKPIPSKTSTDDFWD